MERSVLHNCEAVPFDRGMRRLGETTPKFIDEARLAKPGLAHDLNKLPLAGSCALPALDEHPEIVFASNQRCIDAGAGASRPPLAV